MSPIDGHDMDALLSVLKRVRDIRDRPVLVHVVTQKGKGYARRSRRRQISWRGEVRCHHR